jgi:hypothetical protein
MRCLGLESAFCGLVPTFAGISGLAVEGALLVLLPFLLTGECCRPRSSASPTGDDALGAACVPD